jgi:phosphoribosylformimino-5-aminoimidazole carboxamide ribotide isomerase
VDLFPAIDLRRGCVVRLSQGEAERAVVYETDPAAVAERFAEAGATWIHVVDLDRAFGEGDNNAAVARIVAAVGTRLRVQVGGGFRSLERIEEGLAEGAARVVVGTAAVRDPELVDRAVARAGAARLAVGIDARDGVVAVRGWTETGNERADELAARVVAQGIETVIYTDIGRDGMLLGPDVAGSVALQQIGARVIASGGVATLADLRAIRDAGLAGAIVGRALYERRFTVAEAVEVAAGRA